MNKDFHILAENYAIIAEDIYKKIPYLHKLFPQFDEDDIEGYVQNFDPTYPKGKFATWILKQMALRNLRFPEDIDKVRAIIKELDEFEYDYLPDNYIAHFSEFPGVEYTGKFDDLSIDELTAICWERGIHIWVFDAGHSDSPWINMKYNKEVEP